MYGINITKTKCIHDLSIITWWKEWTHYHHMMECMNSVLSHDGMYELSIITWWNAWTQYYHMMECMNSVLSHDGMYELSIITRWIKITIIIRMEMTRWKVSAQDGMYELKSLQHMSVVFHKICFQSFLEIRLKQGYISTYVSHRFLYSFSWVLLTKPTYTVFKEKQCNWMDFWNSWSMLEVTHIMLLMRSITHNGSRFHF